jgi:serine O-acetyltransferase
MVPTSDSTANAARPTRRKNGGANISASEPDWSREECRWWQWEPSRQLLRAIRRYQRWRHRLGPLGRGLAALAVLQHRFWSVVTGADIPVNARIAGGLLMPHPNGIVVHPEATVGPNCLIFQQVTLGVGGRYLGAPRVGGQVNIGAGAKILGGVTVGDRAQIGANAVVVDDVPPGCTAAGIPARIISCASEPCPDGEAR